jgi:hypothetical protein
MLAAWLIGADFPMAPVVRRLIEAYDAHRAALEDFANPQHWAVSRRFSTPEHIWIGTVEKHPAKLAQEALDA